MLRSHLADKDPRAERRVDCAGDNPQVRLDGVILAAFDRLARRRGQSRAAVLREALTAYLLASPDAD
jgi:hypothetical protein